MVRRGVMILLAVVLVGLVLAGATWARGPATVYTVAQVAAGLALHPRAWVGRTVTVRGTLVMVEGQGAGVSDGTWAAYCPNVERCSIRVPNDTPLHMVLVAHRSYTGAAANTHPPQPMPAPHLVVLVPARRVHHALGPWSQTVQRAVYSLPDGVVRAIYQVPLLARLVETNATVQGDTPRLYRMRLLTPVPTARRPYCTVVCDDAVLLDSLH